MEVGAKGDLECHMAMDGKTSNNGIDKKIPSCCLKARASAPESDAKCHSTVVSGWFSQLQSSCGNNSNIRVYLFLWLLLEHNCIYDG